VNESGRCAGPGVSPDYDELDEVVQHEPSNAFDPDTGGVGGPDQDRTGDLLNAIQARSQLRYRPTRGLPPVARWPMPRSEGWCEPSIIPAIAPSTRVAAAAQP
jgi:hypothetical protein